MIIETMRQRVQPFAAFLCGQVHEAKEDGKVEKEEGKMGNEANEVMYKIAEYLLKKMQESGLISQEERQKITLLNIETFSPELAKVYM